MRRVDTDSKRRLRGIISGRMKMLLVRAREVFGDDIDEDVLQGAIVGALEEYTSQWRRRLELRTNATYREHTREEGTKYPNRDKGAIDDFRYHGG